MTNTDWPIDKAERREPTPRDKVLPHDPDYVKNVLGNALTEGLADIVKKFPDDPIEHLAHFLYKYRDSLEQRAAEEERKALLERELKEKLLAQQEEADMD